jgi:YegS/Rv2252/BmrU family lipid kinase
VTSPFGRLVIIVNPASGHGRSEARLRRIESALRDQGLDYRILPTTGPGHAAEAAAEALRGGDRFLVAAGGDGTVHEVVNGMVAGDKPIAPDAVLGVLATGSGCDFVRSFGIPGDAVRAARHLTGDTVRTIDLGKVTVADGASTTVRYFANIAQAGLGGSVVARAARLPGAFATTRYFFGFWLTLPRFRPATVRLDVDGQAFEWLAHNVVVANCRFYGGGMRVSPKSQPDDGMLDVLVMAGPKSDAYTIVPRVYRGTHLPHRNIAELRVSRVTVETDAPYPIEADGEMLGTTPATFEVIPAALRLKV